MEKNLLNIDLKAKKGLDWFTFYEKYSNGNKIRINLGLVFHSEDNLFTYAQIVRNGIIKTYRGNFSTSPNSKVVFSFTSSQRVD